MSKIDAERAKKIAEGRASSSAFNNIYNAVNSAAKSSGISDGTWRSLASPSTTSREESLKDSSSDNSASTMTTGKSSWDGSYREATPIENALGWLSKLGEGLNFFSRYETYTDEDTYSEDIQNPVTRFVGNALDAATINWMTSPISAVGTAISSGAEAIAGVPFTEVEDGQIPDYELSAGQKAAAGLKAGLNLGSLGWGDAANVISIAGQGGRAAVGALTGAGVGQKMTQKATDYLAKIGGTTLGAAATQGIKRSFEEAAEEFGESIFDDIRDDDALDDDWLAAASEAAVYGAIGGAVSSGVNTAVQRAVLGDDYQKAMQEAQDKSNATQEAMGFTTSSSSQNTSANQLTFDQVAQATGGATQKPASQLYVDAVNNKRDSAARNAGGTQRIVSASQDVGLRHALIGTASLKESYVQKPRYADQIVQTLYDQGVYFDRDQTTNREQFDQLFFNESTDQIAATLQQLMVNNNVSEVELTLYSSPANKRAVMRKIYIAQDGWHGGYDMRLNPITFAEVQDDSDGDILSHLFDQVGDAVDPVLALVAQSADQGQISQVGWGDTGYARGSRIPRNLISQLRRIILPDGNMRRVKYQGNPLRNTYEYVYLLRALNAILVDGTIQRYAFTAKELDDFALAEADKLVNSSDDAGTVITEVYSDILEFLTNHVRPSAALSTAELQRDALRTVENMIQNLQLETSVILNVDEAVELAFKSQASQLNVDASGYGTLENPPENIGSIGSATTSLELAIDFLLTRALVNKDGRFRLGQLVNWSAQIDRETLKVLESLSALSTRDAIQRFVYALLGKIDATQNPTEVVMGLFQDLVILRTQNVLRDKRIGGVDGISIEDFYQEFSKIYGELVEDFNHAFEINGVDTTTSPLWTALKQPLTHGAHSPSTASAFIKTYQGVALGQIFNLPVNSEIARTSLGEYLIARTQHNANFDGSEFLEIDASTQQFVDELVERYPKERSHIGSVLESIITDAKGLALSLHARYITNNDGSINIDPNDAESQTALVHFYNALEQILGGDTLINLGLYNHESFAKSIWAAGALSRDGNVRLLTILRMFINSSYKVFMANVLDYNRLIRDSRDPQLSRQESDQIRAQANAALEAALNELRALKVCSTSHAAVVTNLFNIINNREPDTEIDLDKSYLATLLIGDLSYRDIQEAFSEFDENILEAFSRTPKMLLNDSSLSPNIKQASPYLTLLQKYNEDYLKQSFNEIKAMIDSGHSIHTVLGLIRDEAIASSVTINRGVLFQFIEDCTMIDHEASLKGDSTEVQQELYQMIATALNHGTFSMLNRAAGVQFGTFTVDEFLKDPRLMVDVLYRGMTYRISTQDGRFYTLNVQTLFDYFNIEIAGDTPTDTEYWALYTQHPEILSLLGCYSFTIAPGVTSARLTKVASIQSLIKTALNPNDSSNKERREKDILTSYLIAEEKEFLIPATLAVLGSQVDDIKDTISSRKKFRDALARALDTVVENIYDELLLNSDPQQDEAQYLSRLDTTISETKKRLGIKLQDLYQIDVSRKQNLIDDTIQSFVLGERAILTSNIDQIILSASSARGLSLTDQDIEDVIKATNKNKNARINKDLELLSGIHAFLLEQGIVDLTNSYIDEVIDADFKKQVRIIVENIGRVKNLTIAQIDALYDETLRNAKSNLVAQATNIGPALSYLRENNFDEAAILEHINNPSGRRNLNSLVNSLWKMAQSGDYPTLYSKSRDEIEKFVRGYIDESSGKINAANAKKLAAKIAEAKLARAFSELITIQEHQNYFELEDLTSIETARYKVIKKMREHVRKGELKLTSTPRSRVEPLNYDLSDLVLANTAQRSGIAIVKAGAGINTGLEGKAYKIDGCMAFFDGLTCGLGTTADRVARLQNQGASSNSPTAYTAREVLDELNSADVARKKRAERRYLNAHWRIAGTGTSFDSRGLTTKILMELEQRDPTLQIEIAENGDYAYPVSDAGVIFEAVPGTHAKSPVIIAINQAYNAFCEAFGFKKIKELDRFGSMVDPIEPHYDLGRGVLPHNNSYQTDPQTGQLSVAGAAQAQYDLKEALRDHRDENADAIFEAFQKEKVSQEKMFGRNCCDIIAQLTTPVIQFKTIDGRIVMMPAELLWTPDASDFINFLAQNNIDINDQSLEISAPVLSLETVQQSVLQECATDPIILASTTTEGATTNQAQLLSVGQEATKRGMRRIAERADSNVIGEVVASIASYAPSGTDIEDITIQKAGSAAPTGKFIAETLEDNSLNADAQIRNANNIYADDMSFERHNAYEQDLQKLSPDLLANGYLIVSARLSDKTDLSTDGSEQPGQSNASSVRRILSAARYHDHGDYQGFGGETHLKYIDTSDPTVVSQEYESVLYSPSVSYMLLIPKDIAEKMIDEHVISRSAIYDRRIYNVGGIGCVIINPMQDPKRVAPNYLEPAPGVTQVTAPIEAAVGIAGLAPSGGIQTIESGTRAYEDVIPIKNTDLFPKADLKYGEIEIVTDDDSIAEAEREFAIFEQDPDTSDSAFIFPEVNSGPRSVDYQISRYRKYFTKRGQYRDNIIHDGNELNDAIVLVRVRNPNSFSQHEYIYSFVPYRFSGQAVNLNTTATASNTHVNVAMSSNQANMVEVTISATLVPRHGESSKTLLQSFAYKGENTFVTEKELQQYLTDTAGIDSLESDIVDPTTGQPIKITSALDVVDQNKRMWKSEEKRAQNLNTVMLVSGIGICIDSNGDLDVAKFTRLNPDYTEEDLKALFNVRACDYRWNLVASGAIILSEDATVNRAIQHVVIRFQQLNRTYAVAGQSLQSPIIALSGLAYDNGKLVNHYMTAINRPWTFYSTLSEHEMLALFHEMNPKLCPKSRSYKVKGGGYTFDADGNMAVRGFDAQGKPEIQYRNVVLTHHETRADESSRGIPSNSAKTSDQVALRHKLEEGTFGEDARSDAEFCDALVRSAGNYSQYNIGGTQYRAPRRDQFNRVSLENDQVVLADDLREEKYNKKCIEEVQKTLAVPVVFTGDQHRIQDSFTQLRKVFEIVDGEWLSDDECIAIIKAAYAYSYNSGHGSVSISDENVERIVSNISQRLQSGKYFIEGGIVPSTANSKSPRIGMPLLANGLMRTLYRKSARLQNLAGSYDQLVTLAVAEQDRTDQQLKTLVAAPANSDSTAEMLALGRLSTGLRLSHNLESSLALPYGGGDRLAYEKNMNPLVRAAEEAGILSRGAQERFRQDRDESIKRVKEARSRRDIHFAEPVIVGSGLNATCVGPATERHRALEVSQSLGKSFALISPTLAIANRVGSFVGNAETRLRLLIDKGAFGRRGLSDDVRRELKGQLTKETLVAFSIINELRSQGRLNEAVIYINEALQDPSKQDIPAAQLLIDYAFGEHVESDQAYERIFDTILAKTRGIATAFVGGSPNDPTSGIRGQLLNTIELLYMSLNEDNQIDSFWLREVDSQHHTFFEQMLLEGDQGAGVINLLISFTAHAQSNREYELGNMAMNRALSFNRMQVDCVTQFFHELLRQHPIGEFFLSLGFTKFPSYAYLTAKAAGNYVFPFSSAAYLLRQWAIRKAQSDKPTLFGVDLNSLSLLESAEYGSLCEAFRSDVLKMGLYSIVSIVAGLLKMEPPEDDEGNPNPVLMGNVSEWTITIFGVKIRLAEAYQIKDVIGPALAIAAFAKSCALGMPRLDLITNWYLDALTSNPFLNATSVVSQIFDLDGGLEQGLVSEESLYATEEELTPLEYATGWLVDVAGNYLNWFVPAIVREITTMSLTGTEREVSYKLVQARDASGNLMFDENGDPVYEETSYIDQRIRRFTRNNIVLGWFVDTVTWMAGRGDGTGYTASEMPPVELYEQDELDSLEYYSITYEDEYGETQYKSTEEVNTIALEVIQLISNYSAEELTRAGVVVPYATREYISKLLHDELTLLDNQWNEFFEYTNGGDANTVAELIGGDFNDGLLYYKEAKNSYYDDRELITDLYSKLWDSDLKMSLTKYNRYKTQYDTDANGNLYATGFYPSLFSMVTGFMLGDTSETNTLGSTGQWESRSVKNPERSAGGRSLVGETEVYSDTPSIDSWGTDENDGYSDSVSLTLGSLTGGSFTDVIDDLDDFISSNSSTPSYYSYGGSSGGSSYVPNIYSNVPNVNYDTAKTMYTSRSYSPDFDYLRPNFERKGSRTAYTRSDI